MPGAQKHWDSYFWVHGRCREKKHRPWGPRSPSSCHLKEQKDRPRQMCDLGLAPAPQPCPISTDS